MVSVIPDEMESALKKYTSGMQIILEGARARTGQTPKEVVWTKNKAQLYHYEPMTPRRFRVPVMLIYALINRPYILDLMPGNSFVEFLVGQGFDVYMLDWGIPGDEDKDLHIEDYVMDYIPRAVKKVLRTSGVDELTVFGYCMGGTFSAMYAALFPEKPLKNLVLLTAPIDFTPDDVGLFGLWTSEKYFNPDLVVDAFGNVPADMIDTGNRMLKPVTNYVGTYVNLWERIMEDKSLDSWLAMSKWVNDGVPLPGEAFRQWIRDFYQHNKLVKAEVKLRGRTVDLSRITCPLLTIAGSKDHICTLPQARAVIDLVSSRDKEFMEIDAGHVGLLAGSGAKKMLWPQVRTWLASHSA
jgi:polyhydroxyalkanoate synthase